MSGAIKLVAELKQKTGKGVARAIRNSGKVPAIVYGGKAAEEMLAVSKKEFLKEYLKGGIRTKLIEIDVGGRHISALVHDVQLHPVSDQPEHIDFLRVNKDTVVKVSIAVKIINEEKAPGIKRGGVLNVVNRYIEIFCNPTKIPNHIDVDILNLEIGQNLHINDIKLPEGTRPVDKTNFTVVSIAGRSAEEAKPAPVAAAPAVAAPAAKKDNK